MSTHNRKLFLSSEDRTRLAKIARWFDLGLRSTGGAEYELISFEPQWSVVLPVDSAFVRLLMEICTRCAPWVYFHLEESCRDSLLNHTDARIRRFAELYQRDLEARFQA